MAELFNNEFYATTADDEKPEFPDLDEELEIGMLYLKYDCLIIYVLSKKNGTIGMAPLRKLNLTAKMLISLYVITRLFKL